MGGSFEILTMLSAIICHTMTFAYVESFLKKGKRSPNTEREKSGFKKFTDIFLNYNEFKEKGKSLKRNIYVYIDYLYAKIYFRVFSYKIGLVCFFSLASYTYTSNTQYYEKNSN